MQQKLLLIIGEAARPDNAGQWSVPRAELERRADRRADSIGRALASLARDHGIETRVPIGKRNDGVPLFAANGRAMTYRFPIEFWDGESPCSDPSCDRKAGPTAGLDEKVGRAAGLKPGPTDGHHEQARPCDHESPADHPTKPRPAAAPFRLRDSVDDLSRATTSTPATMNDDTLQAAAELAARETGMRVADVRNALSRLGKKNPEAWVSAYIRNGDQENLRSVLEKEARKARPTPVPPPPSEIDSRPATDAQRLKQLGEIYRTIGEKKDLNAS